MNLPRTPAQAFRAMFELPGHAFEATARATDLLGKKGVETAVVEIGAVLVQADAFNEHWVSVTFWDHDGERLQAISRFWPEDGSVYRTEISLVEEEYGGFAVSLAQLVLEELTPEERRDAEDGSIGKLDPNGDDNGAVIIHEPYQIICLRASAIHQEERSHE